jgi:hypothetical protein
VPPRQIRARVRILRVAGELLGSLEIDGSRAREIRSPARDCDEVVASLALALAIRIDPESLVAGSASTEPEAARDTEAKRGPERQDSPVPAPPMGTEARAHPLVLRSSIGVVGSVGSGPEPTAGATVQLGIRWRDASVGLEGRGDLPTEEAAASGGRVRSGLLAGSVVPCIHHRAFLGCLLGVVGVLRASGESVQEAKSESIPFLAFGARIGAEVPLASPLSIRAHLDAMAPLTRATLRLDNAPVWRTPAFSSALGAALVASF